MGGGGGGRGGKVGKGNGGGGRATGVRGRREVLRDGFGVGFGGFVVGRMEVDSVDVFDGGFGVGFGIDFRAEFQWWISRWISGGFPVDFMWIFCVVFVR